VRAASILLPLVVVLGFVREAGAIGIPLEHNYTVRVGDHAFGFVDFRVVDTPIFVQPGTVRLQGVVKLGPLGSLNAPFTATQGLIGFSLILALLIIVSVVLTVRWRRRATS
jgi:hypothetical protein